MDLGLGKYDVILYSFKTGKRCRISGIGKIDFNINQAHQHSPPGSDNNILLVMARIQKKDSVFSQFPGMNREIKFASRIESVNR